MDRPFLSFAKILSGVSNSISELTIYEHKHLSGPAEWRMRNYLQRLGYKVHYANPSDTLAITPAVPDRLMNHQHELVPNKWAKQDHKSVAG